MNFKTTLTLTCIALMASYSFAGKLYFVSSTVLTSPTPIAVSPFSVSSSAHVSGSLLHTEIHFGIAPPNPPASGTVVSNTLGNATAQFKVRWEEDYPGEPKPSTLTAEWTVYQESHRWPHFSGPGGGSGYLSMTGQAVPNANENFSDTFNWPALTNTTTSNTVTQVPSGAFTFANDNGDWIGTGEFGIEIQLGVTGVLSARAFTMPEMYIKIDTTLTHAGGIAIL